jgi:hypothetical protein
MFSETSVETQRTTRRHIPKDDTLQHLDELTDLITFKEDLLDCDVLSLRIITFPLKPSG